MAKTLIRNKIASKTFGMALPASAETAKAFADVALEGEYAIFERKSEQGNDTEAQVIEYVVTGKSEAGFKTTFSFYANANKTEVDIKTALLEKTFNGVKFDEIYIISAKYVKG
ncbi:hypothetical protein CPIN18021_0315 [Campylobacter pinnipediorum subsp. caledonicus]|uniref:Uncharacterized protein n=1 Tax=Campylobacter pinnipediorum subsp. caledonicus TaxID=1874362 RepID=A0A1S6U647_9BACT|nr:hypothetical protein [Campylobacter pinnipediorum]AQW84185.1 hypothetical protein CPIN17262_0484 [Campylobacter pinnipediorum subsp. pinnipediorum]AQW85523.1 hypothetical protein CPIN18020_0279 [Campylobacter pinnipediorum subsp. caledonicus]AQW87162.1 hypothetical protein CPIN18021_0315 [Campylobacter pinnipediorum subsp. caledonicus]OPA72035.1 hypothetical protein BB381_00335 [Campylobacter pinnipediorum subsp. caledonicus]